MNTNEQPTPPTPTPTLPPEVREAIDAAAKKINWRLNTTHYVDIAGIIRDEIAPLWPRPAPVTADARELAERIHKAVFAGESHPDAETDAIAAILAPVVAELERQRAGNRDLLQWVGCKMLNAEWDSFKQSLETIEHWKARAEAAERDAAKAKAAFDERDAEHFAVQVALNASDAPASGSQADQVRTLQAMLEAAEAKLAEAVRERDQLRAEVERLTRGGSDATG